FREFPMVCTRALEPNIAPGIPSMASDLCSPLRRGKVAVVVVNLPPLHAGKMHLAAVRHTDFRSRRNTDVLPNQRLPFSDSGSDCLLFESLPPFNHFGCILLGQIVCALFKI